MAKKAENKPKDQAAVAAAMENTDTVSGTAAETGEPVPEAQEDVTEVQTAAPETPEPVAEVQTPQAPVQEVPHSIARMEEILNNDAALAEKDLPLDDSQQDADPPEEKILFYVRTVNDKTAIRSTPEYRIDNSNVTDITGDREPQGITEVTDGFGRLTGNRGWILLDPGVVIRQE